MRFLHTSDWHLGAMDSNHSLLSDQEFFINEICRIIEEENIDAVLLAGDVFDRPVASADAVALYDKAMTRICLHLKTKVFCVAGNHDGAERLSNLSELLGEAGLYISGAIEHVPQFISFEDTDIYFFPWFTEEKIKSLYPELKDEITSLEDAYRIVTDHARETFDKKQKHIAVAHAFITKAEVSESDRACQIGFATQVGAEVFKGFDYVALGHLHRSQTIECNNGNLFSVENISNESGSAAKKTILRYAGAPMPYSFGREEKQQKSVTVIDTDTMEVRELALPLLHRRTTITGTLEEVLHPESLIALNKNKEDILLTEDEHLPDIDKALLTGDGHLPDEVINGYTRIRITDEYAGVEAIDLIKQKYPNALEISGKNFENVEGAELMSMEEFTELESDPVEIFRHFCADKTDMEPDDRLIEMFRESMEEYYNMM